VATPQSIKSSVLRMRGKAWGPEAPRGWFNSRTREQNKNSTWECPLSLRVFFRAKEPKGKAKVSEDPLFAKW
jgi:hypothetical protein